MRQELPDLPVPATEPIPNPSDVLDAARTAWASGAYALAVVAVLLAVARGLYAYAERYPTAWATRKLYLGNAKVRAGITGAISVLVALSVELGTTTGLDWGVLVGSVCAAVALFLRPEPKGAPPDLPRVDVVPSPPPVPRA